MVDYYHFFYHGDRFVFCSTTSNQTPQFRTPSLLLRISGDDPNSRSQRRRSPIVSCEFVSSIVVALFPPNEQHFFFVFPSAHSHRRTFTAALHAAPHSVRPISGVFAQDPAACSATEALRRPRRSTRRGVPPLTV